MSLPVIAIDGNAASGKGTLAKALARHFGFDHLDTGSLYRTVAALVLETGGDPASHEDAMKACAAFRPGAIPDADLRTAAVGEGASKVAAMPDVRAALFKIQTDFASHPPGGKGAVLDGRDIGTVICPKAPAKLFVTATVEERTRRRWRELDALGMGKPYENLLEDLKARDARDAGRDAAPMVAAPDAVLLDTTNLSIDAAVAAALSAVRDKIEA